MKAYWWRAIKNFGDELTSEILKFLGVDQGWSPPEKADLVVTGSILEHLPVGWTGTVCGAGKLFPDSDVDLSNANVLAVRGKLTRDSVRGVDGTVVLGDPGLLIPRWVRQVTAKHELGIIPHWSDKELYNRFRYGTLIDPTRPAVEVVTQLAQCKRIISSSLHGLIVADAYGIPRQAELFPQAEREGGDWKFRDYASVYDEHPHFGEMWTAPFEKVHRIQDDLFKALTEAVGQELPPAPAPPRLEQITVKGPAPQISILIPFRDDHEDRNRVLDWLTKYWLHHLPSAEIVLGYHGGLPFSKSSAVNSAAKKARGRIFVIADADAYLRPSAIQDCADAIDQALAAGKRKWLMPYSQFYRIARWETLCLLQTDPTAEYAVSSPPPDHWLEPDANTNTEKAHRFGALIQIMPREAFEMVGGFDGRMRGWGSEDSSMLKSLDTLYCQHEVANNHALHLWHARPGTDFLTRRWIGQSWTPANARLAQRYAAASGEPALMQGLVDERTPRRAPVPPVWLPQAKVPELGLDALTAFFSEHSPPDGTNKDMLAESHPRVCGD